MIGQRLYLRNMNGKLGVAVLQAKALGVRSGSSAFDLPTPRQSFSKRLMVAGKQQSCSQSNHRLALPVPRWSDTR